MKHFKQDVIKSGAMKFLAVLLVLDIVYTVINTAILRWLSLAITEDHMYYISLIAIGCVINTLSDSVRTVLQKVAIGRLYEHMVIKFNDKVTSVDYDLFVKTSTGSVITAFENLVEVSKSINVIRSIITSVIQLVTIGAAIFIIDKSVLLPILVVYIVISLVLPAVNNKWKEIDTAFNNSKILRNKEMNDIINGFAEVRSFKDAVEKHKDSILYNTDKTTKLLIKKSLVSAQIIGITQMLDSIIMIFILISGIKMVDAGTLTSALVLSLVMYGWRIITPTIVLLDSFSDLSEVRARIQDYEALMNYENRVPEGKAYLTQFRHCIEFDNVFFSYDSENLRDVLRGVSFKINKGEHIGICGHSGCGKSTLLKLIPKFYMVDGGRITIDGVDIKLIENRSLRAMIGIVHQDPYIFDGTIMDNLIYACNKKEVDYTNIYNACKKVAIYDFIMSLDKEFGTKVGPKGMKLSGGQKQRISLARLLIADPDIIILDEATSSLDTETEQIIQESLSLFKDKTMIVAAHRLSTIKDNDKIFVINDGEIVEKGTHKHLLNKGGIYSKMCNVNKKMLE